MNKIRDAVLVCVLAQVFSLAQMGQGVVIDNYFSGPNRVLAVDYKDGTFAFGTESGMFVMKRDKIITLDEASGLPDNVVPNVLLTSADCLFAGPVMRPEGLGFIEVTIRDGAVLVTDITGDQVFEGCKEMVAVDRAGSLWVGDDGALRRYTEGTWESYEWPSKAHGFAYRGRLCADYSGAVWGATDARRSVFRFQAGEWTYFDEVSAWDWSNAIGVDPQGEVWLIDCKSKALVRFNGAEWERVSDDPVWGRDGYRRLVFDDLGATWAVGWRSLVKWQDGAAREIDEACDLEFQLNASALEFFRSATTIGEQSVLFGTYGYGLLGFDGRDFWRFFVDSIPGNFVTSLALDSGGSIWVKDYDTKLLASINGGRCTVWSAFWLSRLNPWADAALDIEGRLWFASTDSGAFSLINGAWRPYCIGESPLQRATEIAMDGKGTMWFIQSVTDSTIDLLSFDGHAWSKYSPRECLDGNSTTDIVAGPGDSVWFEHFSVGQGYTSLDGNIWHSYYFGDGFPDLSCPPYYGRRPISFDLTGRAIVFSQHDATFADCPDGAFRGTPRGTWEMLYDGSVTCLQSDSSGTFWIGTDQGVAFGIKDRWRSIGCEDGLSHGHITAIVIDHNGDKWVGTEYGLNRIEDGGPAQQKFELSVEERPDGYVTVSGTFTNAGAVIPVLLWVACEYDGTLYYYPGWGPTPEVTKRVLGAYSIETEELARLDTSTLPPGDYTFYGGISLLGGMDLLIGARGAKIALATYHK